MCSFLPNFEPSERPRGLESSSKSLPEVSSKRLETSESAPLRAVSGGLFPTIIMQQHNNNKLTTQSKLLRGPLRASGSNGMQCYSPQECKHTGAAEQSSTKMVKCSSQQSNHHRLYHLSSLHLAVAWAHESTLLHCTAAVRIGCTRSTTHSMQRKTLLCAASLIVAGITHSCGYHTRLCHSCGGSHCGCDLSQVTQDCASTATVAQQAGEMYWSNETDRKGCIITHPSTCHLLLWLPLIITPQLWWVTLQM